MIVDKDASCRARDHEHEKEIASKRVKCIMIKT